jgi:thiol-disulfide isomerase/thioredoxin
MNILIAMLVSMLAIIEAFRVPGASIFKIRPKLSMSMVECQEGDFEKNVMIESKGRPVVVDFYAEWCGPCKVSEEISHPFLTLLFYLFQMSNNITHKHQFRLRVQSSKL